MTNTITSASAITLEEAKKIIHSLSKTTKMNCFSYGFSASHCITGSTLMKKNNSVCSSCYACKGSYQYPSYEQASNKRLEAFNNPKFVDAMVKVLENKKTKYFRWFDSGDLLSLEMLNKIIEIANRLPDFKFWLPTKEIRFIKAINPETIPANLIVRLSSYFVDQEPLDKFSHTSTVKRQGQVFGFECKSKYQNNKCLDCRACWNKSIANISYNYH